MAAEAEPNDRRDAATPLPLGTAMRAAIEIAHANGAKSATEGSGRNSNHRGSAHPSEVGPDPDVDWFRIDVETPGMLSVLVTPTSNAALAFELVDPSGTVMAKSQRSGSGIPQGVPNIAVTRGRYAAMVRSVPQKTSHSRVRATESTRTASYLYEIVAKMNAPVPGGEIEPNGERDTASAMTLNTAATGYVGWVGDVDVWQLSVETLSSRNAVDIDVAAVDGVALEIDIANGLGESIVRRNAPRGTNLVVKGLMSAAPPQSPPFYYLTIRAPQANPEAPYQLRATAHIIGVDAEMEPNDTVETAQSFPTDRTIIHATWTAGDIDCFALPPRGADQREQTIRIVIAPRGDFDPEVEVMVKGARQSTANAGGRGAPEQLSIPADSGAILLVRSADRTATGDATYDVSIASSD